jgi:hypothetical protein
MSVSSILIVLGERHTQTGVDSTEYNGMGHHLNDVGLAGRQGQQNARGQQDKENHGDNDVHIHLVCI